jgi:acyl carrier protein
MTPEDVSETVRLEIAKALALDPSEVHLDSNLMDDLAAESIDFLDIVFQLEQRYEIEITRGALENAARGRMTEEEFAPEGVISPAGLARLRQLMPEAAGRIRQGLRPKEILSLFTVRTFVSIVVAQRTSRQP